MLSFLYNIKNLNKENKKIIKFKTNKKIVKLANILLINNLIFNYTVTTPYIIIRLKPYFLLNKPIIKSIKSYSNSNKILNISYKNLYDLTIKNPTSLYVLNTIAGLLDNQKALSLKIGGMLLFKIN